MTGCKDRQNEYQNDMQTSAYFRTDCHISGTCTRFYKKDTAEPLYLHINKSFINIGKNETTIKRMVLLCRDQSVIDTFGCLVRRGSLGLRMVYSSSWESGWLLIDEHSLYRWFWKYKGIFVKCMYKVQSYLISHLIYSKLILLPKFLVTIFK